MFRRLGVQALSAISRTHNVFIQRNVANLYEPPYLALLRPPHPIHETLNFQIRGYDFALLESYQKFLHRLGNRMDLDVADTWATPGKQLHITRLQPHSAIVDVEYALTLCERTVQFVDVPAPIFGILLRLAHAGLPAGVSLEVVEHQKEHDEIRYVPDKELIELKDQLDEMGGARKKKKK